jgi:hypothetical protein
MMRLARRALLLVAFYLLMSVATAYAECASVLWISTNSGWNVQETETIPSAAVRTQRECERLLSQIVAKQGNLPNHTSNPEAGVVFTWSGKPPRPSNEAPMIMQSWQCFPGTIDPRGRRCHRLSRSASTTPIHAGLSAVGGPTGRGCTSVVWRGVTLCGLLHEDWSAANLAAGSGPSSRKALALRSQIRPAADLQNSGEGVDANL